MAAHMARRGELSRGVRDDLIHLGLVSPGPAVRLAHGSQISGGDLIACTQNDHSVETGEPGRTLANGALLKVDAVARAGLVVRRATRPDPTTERPRRPDR